jgi:hypothetical protein
MALRINGLKRRHLEIGIGLLLCASVGCNTTKEDRMPTLSQLGKPMGAGNQVMSPPTSPAYSNLAGGNTGGSVNFANSPPYVNAPAGNSAGKILPDQNTASMQGLQLPSNPANGKPAVYSPPATAPNSEVSNITAPQIRYPEIGSGMSGQNLAPVIPQQSPNYQAVPQQPPVLPAPVTPSVPMSGLKIPDSLPPTVMGLDEKVMPGGAKMTQVSATSPVSDPPPAENKTSIKVFDLAPKRVGERPAPAPEPQDAVLEAPLTVFPKMN